jgi:hypothetical protein
MPLLPLILGLIGGLANSILIDKGFAFPRTLTTDDNRRIWDPGFFGNLTLGAIASVLVYYLGSSQLPSANQAAVSIISGIGGGNLLTSVVQKYEASLLQTKLEGLERTVRNLSQPPNGAAGS